ncbi:MAG: ferredoxin [Candidatus Heimdallarchaeota archaeon]|nr:ferredoxin [Candidatus Heimdallarchaeota archaeon]
MPVEIDDKVCGKCLGCATICPETLYSLENDRLVIADGCTDCGLCIDCCPVKAIKYID